MTPHVDLGVIEISSDEDDNTSIYSLDHSTSDRQRVSLPPVAVETLIVDQIGLAPLYIDDDDGAIIVLNEPKSARKPICDLYGTRTRPDVSSRDTIHDGCRGSESEGFISLNHSKKRKGNVNAERARRIKYAEDLFRELNRVTFKGNLPEDTKLIWNKRLLTTAGRAKWHRSRDGSQRTEIELADKILDCDERIRNTLSHEMCHLATWIIDRDPKQGHGKLWKHWAAKVMKHRPEIKISTRHDYDISYPYQWKCANCAKIYGRFSKSIHPAECICGACKQGELIPLFHEKPKKIKAIPTLATSEPKGPPHSLALTCHSIEPGEATIDLNSDSEVEAILTTFESISIK